MTAARAALGCARAAIAEARSALHPIRDTDLAVDLEVATVFLDASFQMHIKASQAVLHPAQAASAKEVDAAISNFRVSHDSFVAAAGVVARSANRVAEIARARSQFAKL